jgi:uncharacterized repeat protein (TIGR03803 family)
MNRNSFWAAAGRALAVILVLAVSVVTAVPAEAQVYKVLHTFTGGDGAWPYAGLIRVSSGAVFGTTWSGGDYGYGVVFKLNSKNKEIVIHSFAGYPTDGANPRAPLVRDSAGNLYGTTVYGGSGTCNDGSGVGCGTIFKIDADGTETVLYDFTGGNDGAYPYAGLVRDSSGALYGTAVGGGASGVGTVFELDAVGTFTVLDTFTGKNGANPYARLVRGPAGNFYGTTWAGGKYGYGVAFKWHVKSGKANVLYSFTGGADGANPMAGVIRDAGGNLYGTTCKGGSPNCNDYFGYGCGTVFKLTPPTTPREGHTETVLYTFPGAGAGAHPFAGLARDPSTGNVFGTTYHGGAYGWGLVFKLDTNGAETVLYDFTNSHGDGGNPWAAPVRDGAGNLYGTAEEDNGYGIGVVFEITP